MSHVLRSVNTKIWSDEWFENLTPSEKLIFIYLITNKETNMLGVYEISIRRISFETGIPKETIVKALEGFERVKKVKYVDGYIILLNFLKNQNMNTNMKKSACVIFDALPQSIKNEIVSDSNANGSEGFERLYKGFERLRKIEVEIESELEIEIESENNMAETKVSADIDFQIVWDLYDHKKNKATAKRKWKALKPKDQEAALEHIPKFVEATPDTQFRPHFATYINKRRWEDEHLPNANGKTKNKYEFDENGNLIL